MKRTSFLIPCALFIISMLSLSACVSKSDYEKLQEEFQNAQASINDLQLKVNSTQSDLDSTKNTLNETQNSLAASERNLKSAQNQLSTANSNLKSAQNQLDAASGKLKLYQDTLGVTVNSDIQPPYNKTTTPRVPINISNNEAAKNPTWQQLVNFILADKTDIKPYITGVFMCGGFAEEVHNNAEAAGIRAALVGIDFSNGSVGHALNAFRTTDKGLVYIDCTGPGLQTNLGGAREIYSGWDKVAYLAKGKEYGILALDIKDSTNYAFYQKARTDWDTYKSKLATYNQNVRSYNAEISGRTYYIGSPELARINQWKYSLIQQENELDKLRATLIDIWEPLGVVSNIEIYW